MYIICIRYTCIIIHKCCELIDSKDNLTLVIFKKMGKDYVTFSSIAAYS